VADTIICRRCGVANTAGDQFCGSCGAFLEWQSDESATEAPDAPDAPPISEPGAGAGATAAPADGVSPPSPPAAAEPAPLASLQPPAATAPRAPEAVAAAAQPQPQAGFTVCPHCGSGNPPGRTFCHKCGKLLARTEPAAGAAGSSRAGREKAAGGRSRGLPGWLPLIIGAGLLVGIVIVLVTVVFKPALPPPVVAPSATLTPTLVVPPSVSLPPPASGTAASGAAPPSGAGQSIQLTLSGATASSVSADTPDVAAGNVIDGRLDTRWEEAVGSAPGEWVEVTFAASRLDYLVVYNGFQLSHDSFIATRRPENVVVTVNGGSPVGFTLADSETPQKLDIADATGATVVRIQIASTYPASASAYPGSPIDAATISEIRAFGAPGG
jgi:ribosomal protein L40E